MSNVLLFVSGSISAYKSCALISLLKKKGHEVKVIASKDALNFVGKASFEGLSHNPLNFDIFESKESEISHITLSQRWADLIIAYPASADCINKLAAGIADTLFGAVCLANNFQKPLLIAPAMNTSMFLHPATQHSIKTLAEWGAKILPCEEGALACGEFGTGRLLEPDDALRHIEKALQQ